MEKTINFKVSEELYKRVKVKIALEGMTLKDYVIKLIIDDLEQENEK